jgi:hypothetical protein
MITTFQAFLPTTTNGFVSSILSSLIEKETTIPISILIPQF